MKERAKQIAEFLKVIANENRLIILENLIDKPEIVSELAKKVPYITQSALSQHLALLKAHGLIDSEKSGQNITYSISDYRIEEIINVLKKYYC